MVILRLCAGVTMTIVVAENKQLSQFYIPKSGDSVLMNHVNVATSNISSLACFASNGDVVVCTESDRGVFLLSARELRIVKRWRAPIRSTVVKCVGECVGYVGESMKGAGGNVKCVGECVGCVGESAKGAGGNVKCAEESAKETDEVQNIAYLCGDDNELLMFNCSGKEEKDSALRERHSLNVRSRSRIIGICLEKSTLYMLGQNGDLDAITNPYDFFTERRKRRNDSEENKQKRLMMDD